MGLAFSRLWERMFGKKEMRILMVSGKGREGGGYVRKDAVNIRTRSLLYQGMYVVASSSFRAFCSS